MSGVAGIGRRLARLARRGRAARPLATVLMYHRVASPPLDPWGLCVSEARFAAHVRRLSRDWHVLSANEVAAAVAERRALPERSVAITFDDGYRDNLAAAAPILAAASLPATFFLTSANVETGAPFWWDTVERLCADERELGKGFGEAIRTALDKSGAPASARRPLDADGLRELGLSPAVGRLPRTVRQAYVSLWRCCHSLEPDARTALLASLAGEHARVASRAVHERADTPDEDHAVLNTEDLPALFAEPLFDCGSHGVTHTPLAILGLDEQRRELLASRERLARRSARPVDLCSYPNGVRPAPAVIDASDFPYRAAFTTDARAVRTDDACRALPRVKVDDLDDGAFGRLLEHHASGGAGAFTG